MNARGVNLSLNRLDLVSRTLSGSWRTLPPAAHLSAEELSEITPFLLKTGGAALAWRCLSLSSHRSSIPLKELHQAYRMHALQALLHESRLQHVYSLFKESGLEPLLLKGWGVSRHYTEPGLRPYGDIDLAVHPSEFPAAARLLDTPRASGNTVDLHKGLRTLDRTSFETIYSRSQDVMLGEVSIRVPSHEDHLRILCTHLLGHGAWRPLWLCDIALMIETRPPAFDWTLCLGKEKKRARWVACAVALAHHVLGADIHDLPLPKKEINLPRWLLPALRRQWNSELHRHVSQQNPLATQLHNSRELLNAIISRWPNAIEATVSAAGPFNELPRLPYQLASCAIRTMHFLRHQS